MMLKLKKWAMPFLFLLMLAPAWLHAVAAPTGLAVSPWASGGSFLSWTDDPTVQQWFIYLNAIQLFSPPRSQVSVSGTGRVGFQLTGIAQGALPVVASMRAISGGGLSGYSAGVTITAVGPVPFVYVQTAPGTYLSISGSSGGGGDATAANQVIGNASLSSIDGKLNSLGQKTMAASEPVVIASNQSAIPVTQGGPFTVSGSVSTSPSGAYQGVSVFSGVAGLSVTASQGGGYWGVSVTSMPSGVTVNTHAVTQGSAWTVSGSVSVTNNQGLSVTASQGSAWTVSGSVGVTSGVAGISTTASQGGGFWGVSVLSQVDATSFKGVSIVSDTTTRFYGVTVVSQVDATSFKGVSIVSDTTTRFYGVTVTSGVAGISVTASISGGVSVTNPASAAVQIAGSITNTVAISSAALNIIAAGVTSTGALASNIEGNVASGVATTGNPVGIGGRASVGAGVFPTAVTDGQRVEMMMTKMGKPIVEIHSNPENVTRTTTTLTASTAETTIIALVASTFWDIDSISVINTSATAARLDFRNATAGAVVYSMGAAANYGGFTIAFPTSLVQETAGANWTVQSSASVTDLRINVTAHRRQ